MSARSRGFDQLAPIYRGLEYLMLGRDLERARFCYLERLRDCESILVLGEGDGRCLEKLLRLTTKAQIDCYDLSPAMLDLARKRVAAAGAGARVKFHQADVLEIDLPQNRYDAALTLFFLDCFTAEQSRIIIERISAALKPSAQWLWSDFAVPESGANRWRARAWLAVLYAFFRSQTGITGRKLPPAERLIAENGFSSRESQTFQHGLLRGVVFERK